METNNILMTSKEIFEALLRRRDWYCTSDRDMFGGLGVEIRKLEDGNIVANLKEWRYYIDLEKSYLTNDYQFVVYGIGFLKESYRAYDSKTKEEFESKLELNEQDIFNEIYDLNEIYFRIKNIMPYFKYKNIRHSLILRDKLDISTISNIGSLFTDKLFTPFEDEEYCYGFEGFNLKLKRKDNRVTLEVCIGYRTICEVTHNIDDTDKINKTKKELYELSHKISDKFAYYFK